MSNHPKYFCWWKHCTVGESITAAAMALFIGFVLGFSLAAGWFDYAWQKQAIEHNAAEYNAKTGAWEWKTK